NDYKRDNNDRGRTIKIESKRQWQIITLTKTVGACRSSKRANRRHHCGEKRHRAGHAAPNVHASAAELRPGQWVPREYDRRPTAPGVPEPGTFRSRAPSKSFPLRHRVRVFVRCHSRGGAARLADPNSNAV